MSRPRSSRDGTARPVPGSPGGTSAGALVAALSRAVGPHAVMATAPDATITLFSRGAELMLGYRSAEVVGRRCQMRLNESGELTIQSAGAGPDGGSAVPVAPGLDETRTWTFVRGDGSSIPVQATVSPVGDEPADGDGPALGEGPPGGAGLLWILRDLSADERAQAELARTRAHLDSVFTASPVPTAITRVRDGHIVAANPACLDLLGWDASEFVGHPITELGFWARPERRRVMVDRLRAEGRVRDMEEEIRTRSGEVRCVLTSLELIELDGEQCLVGLFHDISERKRVEAALADRSALLDVAIDAVFARGLDRRITYWSRGAEASYGWSPEEAMGRQPADLLRTEYPAPLVDIEGTVARSGRWTGDLVQYTRDGRRLVVESRWAARHDEGGRVVGILEANRDVTARREANEALRESEQRFRQLADSLDEVVFLRVMDPIEYLYVSAAVETVFGVSPQSVYGDPLTLFRMVHPEDAEHLPQRVASHDSPTEWEFRIRRPDGDVRWLRSRSFPIVGEGGADSRVAGTIEDITARREAADALRAARAEADRANRAKSEFLSRMSHELRTPLNAIIGFGQLLQLDVDEPQRHAVSQILQGGRHLLELINDILDVSRIESGQLKLSLEPVRLSDVVTEAVSLIQPLATSCNLRLSDRVAPGRDDHVRADRQRLRQVVLNLLTNAVKYNRAGGEVEVSCEPAGAGLVRLMVSDTGIGIAEKYLPLLFAPFERLGAEQSGVEGTGLGLTLSRALVEAMGGSIGVDSAPGKGSTFWIELGVATAPAGAAAVTGPSARRHLPPDARKDRTVLYIEDNLPNVQLVEGILARARPAASLLVAMQAGIGLELARQHRPDVILLDLNLPDMPGEEALRQLRADPRTADIPVVVLSADATAKQIARLRALGASAYLTKPFDMGHLLEALDDPSAVARAGAVDLAPAIAVDDEAGVLDRVVLAALRELAGDDSSMTESLISIFLQEGAAQVEGLRAAAAAEDAARIAAVAHSLRGSGASFGAHRLATRCADLQTIARAGEIAAARPVIDDVSREFARARTALCAEFDVAPP